MSITKLEDFKNELRNKPLEEKKKEFENFKESISNLNVNNLSIKTLNVDKINSLDDIKRLLRFLNFSIEIDENSVYEGFEEVKDLFV